MTDGYSQLDEPSPAASPGAILDKNPLWIVAIAVGVVVLFFLLIIYLLGLSAPTTATIRDISIILLAALLLLINLVLLVLVAVLVYLVMKINDLIYLLNTEVKPLFRKANETATTAKNTALVVQDRVTFIGNEAVKPVINVLSALYAIRQILRTLFRRKL